MVMLGLPRQRWGCRSDAGAAVMTLGMSQQCWGNVGYATSMLGQRLACWRNVRTADAALELLMQRWESRCNFEAAQH